MVESRLPDKLSEALLEADDLVITDSNVDEIEKFKSFFNNKFKIKKPGHVMTHLPKNVVLNHKESDVDKFLSNISIYKKLIGKLIYLTHTRHDISYFVHYLSQHMHAYLKSHFDVAMRVLKYLKLAPGLGVNFSKRKSYCLITAFSNSDCAKCPITRRSVSGYCVYINGNLVSWKSKRQATLSRSSVEAE
ncbi:ribonuclease H-like domain-containing protein [Tanacetum coccineum]|uniref:Ribonuclease H-like domain-containing protein n=1 Tax=Tanacetum coccineum TaxID=301880 RepID=A0ABQ5C378_9ASTR